ncbi:DUF3916 domain-containing protein [Zymobacter palmae]|uniref:Cytochrome bd-type quinol oxidase, subunit 1 n=1 Tax=Zymobacter palmae TaxID=33074 RepID=A0A348HCM4_9GAMM|nr:DUF3916 domain-containing protein [Zymobacter palmae]BBG29376.1 cytochrome bd-type quinol oxidase, subunit 1 [Zymobacter palmae]
MARSLSFTHKKLRGVPRRLRAISRWAASFEGYFPTLTDEDYAHGYWSIKIPVACALVEGKQTSSVLQAYCAQEMIAACAHLTAAKPAALSECRVTCCIVLPSMFASELCIYTREDYFQAHTEPGENHFGRRSLIEHQRLSDEWALALPSNMEEKGLLFASDDYRCERWYFGELAAHAE